MLYEKFDNNNGKYMGRSEETYTVTDTKNKNMTRRGTIART